MEKDYFQAITRRRVSNEQLKTRYIIKILFMIIFFLGMYAICVVGSGSFNPNVWSETVKTAFTITLSVCFITTIIKD